MATLRICIDIDLDGIAAVKASALPKTELLQLVAALYDGERKLPYVNTLNERFEHGRRKGHHRRYGDHHQLIFSLTIV